MYSCADLRVSIFVILVSSFAAGKCFLNLSKASFKLCIRFRSLSFALTRLILLINVLSLLVAPQLLPTCCLVLESSLLLPSSEWLEVATRQGPLCLGLCCAFICCTSNFGEPGLAKEPRVVLLLEGVPAEAGDDTEEVEFGDWTKKALDRGEQFWDEGERAAAVVFVVVVTPVEFDQQSVKACSGVRGALFGCWWWNFACISL